MTRYDGCTCSWENGSWDICILHRGPHSTHKTPAPDCDLCNDLLDEAREVAADLRHGRLP
jgi:hypothetical protein